MRFVGRDAGGKGLCGAGSRGGDAGASWRLFYPEGSVADAGSEVGAGPEPQGGGRQGEHSAVGRDAEEEEPAAGVVSSDASS